MKPVVFISHVHEEAALAVGLSHELNHLYLGGLDFFVSSDRESLRGGDDWLTKIKEALTQASVIIALVSPRSIQRTWVNFESGAGWLQKRVIPLCHSGLHPSQLPQPLQSLYSFDLHDPTDLEDLFKLIGKEAGLNLPPQDWHALVQRLTETELRLGPPIIQPYGASPCWVFPMSEDVGTIGALTKSLRDCRTIRVYTIGLNFFWNAGSLNLFEDRLRHGSITARICMANFGSKSIQQRIGEEPEHPIGVPGSEHLVRRLVRLEASVGDASRFALRVFSHYPTYAMLSFDDDLFIYNYGYKSLGNFSPTFHWKGKDTASQFFEGQFESIWADSQEASSVYAA
jgi:hypothetical protein